jgi:hypothetical protein
MKKLILLVLLLFSGLSRAQVPQKAPLPGCSSDEHRHSKLSRDPDYRNRMREMNDYLYQKTQQSSVYRQSNTVLTIPVVVHIIHNNGPENISNAQVNTAIQYLNQAFSNTGPFQTANGVNTNIQFCLASQDENGNYTTGINRVVSTLTDMISENDDDTLKNLIRWNPNYYLNIWVVNSITSLGGGSGVAGYAYLPASHGNDEDGIVNEAAYFGNSPDATKVLIHEAGHYLGLYHTFEGACGNNNCQTDGDKVCDTPPDQSTGAVGCPLTANTCNSDDDDLSPNNPFRPVGVGGLGDQNDLIENYMDYGLNSCKVLFTTGQSDRMQAAITGVRGSLQQSVSCQPTCLNPIIADFNMSNNVVVIGGSLNFSDASTGAIAYEWYVNNQLISTSANTTHVFTSPGYYSITLTVNSSDSTCEESITKIVEVLCDAQAFFVVAPASGPYAIGSTLNFNDGSTNSNSAQWVLDGVNQGTIQTFIQTFNTPGSHYIYNIANSNQCSDTSEVFYFKIGDCGDAGMLENWYLPNFSLHFSGTSLPVVGYSAVPGQSVADECTSSLSDRDGNLLLYTDGLTVWNRNHQPMPNGSGLAGCYSSTQGCLLAPKPGSTTLYYLFTADCGENQFIGGLKYSVIDLSLNGGLGDIITGQKNLPVRSKISEHVGGTYHGNGTDIWISAASFDGDTIYSYLLSAAGLATTPVISPFANGGINGGNGEIKFSNDGLKVAYCINSTVLPNRVRVADFNKNTGIASNPFEITYSSIVNETPFGIEFSPDNSKLYVGLLRQGKLFQYNMAAGTPAAIIASEFRLDPFTSTTSKQFANMSLGPDGRIWISRDQYIVDYIDQPDLLGANCGYTLDLLNNPNPVWFGWAMPNFVKGIELLSTPRISGPRKICVNSTKTFEVAYALPGDSTIWMHHGPGTVSNATDSTIELSVAGAGSIDTLTMKYFGYCGAVTDTFIVETITAAPIDFGPDTILCGFALLSIGNNWQSFVWQDNSTSFSSYGVNTIGTYWVVAVDTNRCIATDTITFTQGFTYGNVDIGKDTTICAGNIYTIIPNTTFLNYEWQDGSTASTYTAFGPGTYCLHVTGGCQDSYDTIQISMTELNVPLALGSDTVICGSGYPYTLQGVPGYSHLWQDGSSNTSLVINGPGQYWVEVRDSIGCMARDSIMITGCVGLNETLGNMLQLFPNPAVDELIIRFPSAVSVPELALYDMMGRLLRKINTGQQKEIRIDTSQFPEGAYILRGTVEEGVFSKMFMVAK